MASGRKAWVVATSIGAVEALKDQLGLCRWNYPLKSLHQYTKNNIRSMAQSNLVSSSSSSSSMELSASDEVTRVKSMRTSEKCMGKVMEISCWGPTTLRF